jgi:hypothetical protein
MKRVASSLVGFGLLLALFGAGEARATIPSCLSFTGYVYLQGDETYDAKTNVLKSKLLKVRLGTKELLLLVQDLFPGVVFPKSGLCIEVDPDSGTGSTTVRLKSKDGTVNLNITAYLSFFFDFAFGEFFNGTYHNVTAKEKSTILFPIEITVNSADVHFDVTGMGTELFNAAAMKTDGSQSISGSIKSRVAGTGTVAGQAALIDGSVSLMGRGTFTF